MMTVSSNASKIMATCATKATYTTITAPLHFPKILRVILQKLLDRGTMMCVGIRGLDSWWVQVDFG